MRVRDLGDLRVEIDGRPVALPGRRPATALTMLLLDPGRPVAADVLVEALWGDDAPQRPTAALDTVIWRLRSVLEPGRRSRQPSAVLPSAAGGFRIDLPTQAVDSWTLDRVARGLGRVDGAGSPSVEVAEDALGRWRGTPFAGIDVLDADGRIAGRRAALVQDRLRVLDHWAETVLRSGAPDAVAAHLPAVLADHPYAEKLWQWLILAQYRSGGTAEALATAQQVRTRLAVDLGVDPGPDLAGLEQRLLRHDPDLLAAAVGSSRAGVAAVPVLGAPSARLRLPRRTDSLIGRETDLHRLDILLSTADVVTVVGPVGCGKTRLAIAAAEAVSSRFRDGASVVDVSDVTAPQVLPERVLAALGLDAGPRVSARDRIAAYLGNRDALLVVDNCEQVVDGVADFVQSLRDSGFPGRVLATSRRPLDMDGERVCSLRPLPVPPVGETDAERLASNAAVRLFLDRVVPEAGPQWSAARRWSAAVPRLVGGAEAHGGVGVGVGFEQAAELAPEVLADVVAVCRAVDGLPLALELAAARSRILTVHEVAALVAADPLGLRSAARARSRPADGLTLRASIEASHRLLGADQQVLHRRLSMLAGPVSLPAMAAVAADRLTAHQVSEAAVALVSQSMLEREPSATPGMSRFRQLRPLRAHAAEQLAAAGETTLARRAVRAFVLDLVRAGPRLGGAGQAAWYTRIEEHRRLVVDTLADAFVDLPDDDILDGLSRLITFWLDRTANADGLRLTGAALDALARRARAGDPASPWVQTVVRAARLGLVAANQCAGEVGEQLDTVVTELRREARGPQRWPAAWWLVVLAACCWAGDDHDRAGAALRAARDVAADLADDPPDVPADDARATAQGRDPVGLRIALDGIDAAQSLMTDPVAGAGAGAAVLVAAEEAQDDLGRLLGTMVLSVSARFTGDGRAGLAWSAQLLRTQQRLGVRTIADTLETRGNHHATVGDMVAAARCYGAAAEQNARNGRRFPRHPGTAELLHTVERELSRGDYDAAWQWGRVVAADDPAVVDL